MVIKLKDWIKFIKGWLLIVTLIVFMLVEIITWFNIKPRLIEEIGNTNQYNQSFLFQREFNECVDKAVELSLKGTNTNKWREVLNTKQNLIYYIYNGSTQEAYSNIDLYGKNSSEVIEYDFSVRSKRYYVTAFFKETGYRVYYDSSIYHEDYEKVDENLKKRVDQNSAVYIGIKQNLEPGDVFYANAQKFSEDKGNIVVLCEIVVWSIFIIMGLWVMVLLYKKIGKKESQYRVEDVPMDIITLLVGSGYLSILKLIDYKMINLGAGIILIGGLSLILVISSVYQIKRKKLIKSTFIYRQYLYWSYIKRLPFGMLLGTGLYLIIGCILTRVAFDGATRFDQAIGLTGLIVWSVLGLIIVWNLAVSLKEIMKAATCISKGDIQYKIDLKKKGFLFKALGNQLNLMGEGLEKAVHNALKSESMKTQLITNVSHDLKTPLTSIINYIGLLKKQELCDEVARNYIEVLDEKSKRLKILIEDLVEISKATTGNIQVELERLDLIQFLDQAIGEYKDKLNQIPIEVKFRYTDEPIWVMADGKHLWRIVENLFSNVVKYAMPNSRLYIEPMKEENRVSFVIKNMTKESIEVLPEDLLQRFVRGEEARSTEGSGLGLAIAKSLTQAQDGDLNIEIDGDLFKVKVDLLSVDKSEL